MASNTPSYITQNRLGIYLFQFKIPQHFRINQPQLGILFRKSLRTRNKRDAIQLARRLALFMDDLAKQFFNDSEAYAKSIKLLQECKDAESLYPRWEEFEQCFLLNLDDYESKLLDNAIQYQRAKQLIEPNSNAIQPENQEQLLNAIEKRIKPPLSDEENPTLETIFERWRVDKQKSVNDGSMRKTSFSEYCRMIELFIRIVNDYEDDSIRINDLNGDHIDYYRTVFSDIPKGIKVKEYAIPELIKITGDTKSPSTIKNTYNNIATFLEYIETKLYPFNSRLIKAIKDFDRIPKKKKKIRIPFSNDELKQLFNSKQYIETGNFYTSAMYWVPLMALYTGARMSEIIQLEKHDVYEADGIWVFNFEDSDVLSEDEDKNLKESGSYREVPIHPELLNLGFIDYVKSIKGRLFDNEPRDAMGRFSDFGKRFATYRNQVGVTPDHDMQLKDFHSFRHTVETRLSDLSKTGNLEERFDQGLIDGIVGHASNARSQGEKDYTHTQHVEAKNKALQQLNYGSVDFNIMIPWNKCRFSKT